MSNTSQLYPLEIVLTGTPISMQSKSAKHREMWKAHVSQTARQRQRDTDALGFLDDRPLAVAIFYFPSDAIVGDIDNIVKPILDGCKGVAFLDDRVVERVVVQKFEPGSEWELLSRSDQLDYALTLAPPVVYIPIDDHLKWRRVA